MVLYGKKKADLDDISPKYHSDIWQTEQRHNQLSETWLYTLSRIFTGLRPL